MVSQIDCRMLNQPLLFGKKSDLVMMNHSFYKLFNTIC